MADLRIVDAPEIPTENITGEEKLPTGGNGNYSISLDSLADYTKTKKDLADNTSVDGKVNGVRQELETHVEDLLNPHQVTKGQIGLGNVDNTADADKPVSNSTQSAIISAVAPKADKTYVDSQLSLKANKADVYTKAETYTKQESNDLVNNRISTALNPVNSSLDLAKRGIANRYDSSLTYNSGERVILTNGDIVKSTINGNTNDPNVNMTGWVKTNSASQIKYENGGNVQDVKDRIVYIQDFGGAYNDFDPSVAEAEAKAIANPSSKPYDGARQFAFPMRTLKVWNYLDGFKDRGAVASFTNTPSFNATEPATQVLGISKASDLASYHDRDVVGLFVQTEGQPTLLTSTNTIFTATTVTCSDFSSVASSIRKGQIIDVVSGATRWSSIVDSVQGNTVTIETGWYNISGGATETPPNAAQIKLVPNTKVWGQNTNVLLHETSDATRIAGFEMGIFNNKSSGSGYGFDVISTGAYKVESGYQARGKLEIGFKSYGGETKYAFAAEAAEIGLNTSQTSVGAFLYKPAIGVRVQEPTEYSFIQTNSTGGLVTGINNNACWESLRFRLDAVSIGETIPNWTVVAIINATSAGGSINLPAQSSGKTVYVRNINATNSVLAVGTMEGGAGGLNIPAKTTVQFISDGAFWYPLSKYTA